MSNPCDTGWCRPDECTDIDCKNGSDTVLSTDSVSLKHRTFLSSIETGIKKIQKIMSE